MGEPFMMLPTDMALWWDEQFRAEVKYYDRNRVAFKEDAIANWTKLGCSRLVREKL